jgi:hypothetical protein
LPRGITPFPIKKYLSEKRTALFYLNVAVIIAGLAGICPYSGFTMIAYHVGDKKR